MRDPRRRLSAARRGKQRALVPILAIPQVDQIVMRAGVHRIHREHLLHQRIRRLPAGERHIVALVIPELENEKRLRLDVVGKLETQILQRLHQRLAPHPLILLRLRVIIRPRPDVELLAPPRLLLPLHRLLDEIPRALRVVDICHRHSPKRHRKDNHIDYCGSIEKAIDKAYNYVQQNKPGLKIEVETRSIDDVKKVLATGKINRIMLDNFTPVQISEALLLIDGNYETEASGGINYENIEAYAATGVDYISSGAIIHQAVSLDLSLKAIIV